MDHTVYGQTGFPPLQDSIKEFHFYQEEEAIEMETRSWSVLEMESERGKVLSFVLALGRTFEWVMSFLPQVRD